MSNLLDLQHGLKLSFHKASDGSYDVWLNVKAENGKHAGVSVAAMAERSGPLIGAALKSWASDRVEEYLAAEIADEEAAEAKADEAPLRGKLNHKLYPTG